MTTKKMPWDNNNRKTKGVKSNRVDDDCVFILDG